MTYHMEKTLPWVRSVELNSSKVKDRLVLQFPWKLWQAVNSQGSLLTWNEQGTGICVNAAQFERSVMQTHPGLVEIPTFANFRRQMREYGFDWTHCKETGDFSFSHQCFIRDRKDLINLIVTRRKSRYVSREEATYTLPSARRSARRGRSLNCVVPARNESFLNGSHSNRFVSNVVPESSSSSQLNAISGYGCPRKGIRNIRLRHLVAEPQSGPSRVEQWISLVPTPSSSSGFGVSTAPPASYERQEKLAQKWCHPVGNDADQRKEENAWWNECFPWILQQDSDLCRQFEVDNLNAAVIQQNQKLGGIPLHFYTDDFHAIPETTMVYPGYLDSPRTSGEYFSHGAVSGAVIEIKPIPDDQEFPDF